MERAQDNNVIPMSDTSFNVPQMETARYVTAPLFGTWLRAWLQNESPTGYWVQFDPDGPFRRVEEIRELANDDG